MRFALRTRDNYYYHNTVNVYDVVKIKNPFAIFYRSCIVMYSILKNRYFSTSKK